MVPNPKLPEAEVYASEKAASLEARYGKLGAELIVDLAAAWFFAGKVAAVSSFGSDSAVLLHMISKADPNLPIIFLDTHKHFDETLEYRDNLIADLGLTNLIVTEPLQAAVLRDDPDGALHRADSDRCCAIRKVEPMARAVAPYEAWFTGRKRHQSADRQAIPVFEASGERVRINPLASWQPDDIAAYLDRHRLRENPLVAYGYLSIGCLPCTQPVKPGEDARAGRWAGQAKSECGIHLGGLEESLTASSL